MFQRRVRRENGIVRFDDGRGNLRRWIDGELQFGLLSIFERQSFHEQRSEAAAGAA